MFQGIEWQRSRFAIWSPSCPRVRARLSAKARGHLYDGTRSEHSRQKWPQHIVIGA